MQILNPCRKCIVRAICRIRCPARQDFWDTREKTITFICKSSVTCALLVLLFIGFYKF